MDYEENNAKIFASIVDDKTRAQVEELANSEAYKDCEIRIMPDCHAGKGCTIGSVIHFRDRVVPNTVGVDIGCGMLVVELGDIDINLEKLDKIINENIPSGFNVRENAVVDFGFDGFVANISNKNYISRSIGTLGGGNHFIELNVDDEGFKYLVIHSGSRNLGVQVCDYWQNKAIDNLTDDSNKREALIASLKSEGRASEIQAELKKMQKPQINKELAYIEGQDLENYLHDMRWCQKYALLNRYWIGKIIVEKLGAHAVKGFTTTHNYIDIHNRIIRKGAIAAHRGDKVIIPMNMRDGSLICIGKGNTDWLCSAPHGAGRIMSRAQAFMQLQMADFEKSMEGIYSTSVCEATIDEAPMVYKSADVIKKDIEPTVQIVKVIKPIYNFKAKTAERR